MKKIEVFLCDLTHTGNGIGTNNIPLNIGVIAAYAKKYLDDQVNFTLFKYPEDLNEALESSLPDVIGFSNYVWNDRLNEYFCNKIKALNPEIVTVKGGPNIPLPQDQKKAYLEEHPDTDFYFTLEAEVAFKRFLERFLASNLKDGEPVDGCVYLDQSGEMITGSNLGRMTDLEEVPSPYLEGLLDKFFDGNLIPVMETTRGCPFSCNFCNFGDDYYSKIRAFDMEIVRQELRYIANKVQDSGLTYLILTDMNFGMYTRDIEVANEIIRCRDEHQWPISVYIETGKNRIDNVSKVVDILKDCLSVKLSLQSNSPEVLEEIKRKNIDQESYWKICRQLKKEGRGIIAEMIVPLPKETTESFYKGINFLMDSKVDTIINYTLQINYGTQYSDLNYANKFDYVSRYRPYVNCFGKYAGDIVMEVEQIGVATNSLTAANYSEVRAFSLMIQILYNNPVMQEVFWLLDELGGSAFDFTFHCFKNTNSHKELGQAVNDFIAETEDEMFREPEAVRDFFSDNGNYDKLVSGDLGRNVIFSNFALILSLHFDALVEFVIEMLRIYLGEKVDAQTTEILEDLRNFLTLKGTQEFSDNADPIVTGQFKYNWYKWGIERENRLGDVEFAAPSDISFEYDANQMHERKDFFQRYGNTPAAMAKMVASIRQERLFRSVSLGKGTKKKEKEMKQRLKSTSENSLDRSLARE